LIPHYRGSSYSCTYITPKTYSDKDFIAVERIDTLLNKAFIEPSLGLGYPIATLPFLKHIDKYFIKGDDELIKVEFDFIGLKNYTKEVVEHNSYTPYVNAKLIPVNKKNVDTSLMNREIDPKSIYTMILKFSEYNGVKNIIVTENGASFLDEIKSGIINDEKRINFIESYLQQILFAKEKTDKVKGYFYGL
jgi:beta-glucosidase